MSRDNQNLMTTRQWLGAAAGITVTAGILGFWTVAAEVVFSWSGALFGASNELFISRFKGGMYIQL